MNSLEQTGKPVVAAIVEARMGSSRLPGKVLLEAAGKPLLQHLVERLQRASLVHKVIVATTVNPADEAISLLCESMGVACFRGSEKDVLDRVLQAALAHGVDIIVQVTGDCPLMDSRVVDQSVEVFLRSGADFFGNRNVNPSRKTFPDGFGVRVFPTKILSQAAQSKDPSDREHVSVYISNRPQEYRLVTCESGLPEKYWPRRFTLDQREDFLLIKNIFEILYPKDPNFSMMDVLRVTDEHPELLSLNGHILES